MPQHKSFRGHAAVKSADEGIAEIVVSAYGNVDHDGDIVVKGASAKQIKGEYGPNPKGMLDHNYSMLNAVAKTLSWWEEDDGLHIEAQYNLEKNVGREAFGDLKFYGDDMEFSVTYSVKDAEKPDPEQKVQGARRVIKEWQIDEWSHVWLGANSDTHLVGAKDLTAKQREVVEAKALIGSYEHLSERLRTALMEAFPSEWLWVRGTMPDQVIFEREVDTFDGYRCSTFQVAYTDTPDGITFDGDAEEVTVSEIVEPKALASGDETTTGPTARDVARFRLLVASTRT